ncbi:MAG: thermosome subunit [Methanobacteriota archaeon]|nr:MAG: thermosome subunit [Euryarchaeota archaeon]
MAMAGAGQMAGQPVLILKEGTSRSIGRDAQRTNILAGRIIAEAVRTTLGPKGMDKMLVDSLGDIVITNDGATILKEIDVQHPAAKMVVEVAKAQDDEVGDGTTTAVVLAGELLKRAEELLDQEIHATTIVSGYRKAANKAIEIINQKATKIDPKDVKMLKTVALTSMTGKGVENAKDHLADLAVKAVQQITEEEDGKLTADIDNIKVEKKEGKSLLDSELIKGIIIDKERVHTGMPKKVTNAKIALVNSALEISKTETDAKIRITSPEQLQAFLDEEERMIRKMVDKVKASGANVLFCQKGIDDLAQHFLAKEGILAARRVKKSDMEKLARATGGNIVTNLDDLTPKDLGTAGVVEEVKVAGDEMIFVKDCKDPKAVSILIRGGTEHVVDEAERALHDGLSVVADVVEDGLVVPGGGAMAVELAKQLRSYADSIGGREQLAIEAFAEALEVIPRTLAENAGLDPIDVLVELRSKHEKPDGLAYGIDVLSGKSKNMMEIGVMEPARVTTQAIKSASEAAEMILRIDDVIAAAEHKPSKGEEGGEGGEFGGGEEEF